MLTASVVICAYTEARWDDTVRAVHSVQRQRPAPHEVILVIDHNPGLQDRFAESLPEIRVVANQNQRGLSGGKNTGVALASGDIVAYLDDDAVAHPGWLAALLAGYGDPRVIGVGGRTEPNWASNRPRWWPREFDWVVGATFTGREPGVVRNLLGGNASFRRELFTVGGFASHIGRSAQHRRPLGCEETEFCIRANRARPDSVFLFDDRAVISHRVTPERETFAYFRSRCFSEGLSKALVTESVGAAAGLAAERRYTAVTLPGGVLNGISHAIRGDWCGLLRAGAIVAGFSYTVVGYWIGLVTRGIHHPRQGGGIR